MASVGGGGSGVLAMFTSGGFSGIVGSPFKRSVNAYAARPKFEEQLGFTAEAQRDIETAVAQGTDRGALERDIEALKQQSRAR